MKIEIPDDEYEKALSVFADAVRCFCAEDFEGGDALLESLDRRAIELDRQHLLRLARAAKSQDAPTLAERDQRSILASVRQAVAHRDHYHCRYTGRRLVDVRIFREVSRISRSFHFDEHHSVVETRRGPAGHPIVRTHGAAFEHVSPHSHGGTSTADNLVLTSVQLNEAKGTRALALLDIIEARWDGLTGFLPKLRQLRVAPDKQPPSVDVKKPTSSPPIQKGASRNKAITIGRIRDLASTVGVSVYASSDDESAEANFRALRKKNKNSFFATERPNRAWMIHRLYCSSLDFTVPRILTASPKICSDRSAKLEAWTKQAGVATETCSRCRSSRA